MMVVAADLVRRDKLPDAHGPAHSTPRPLGVARSRSFKDFSASGVVGDARKATPEKGEKVLTVCRDAIASVLRSDEAWS